MRRWLLASGLALAASAALAQEAHGGTAEWTFAATLDGKPIGTHRFVVFGPTAARRVESRARFTVRVLGIPVYRYRHEADERWQANACASCAPTPTATANASRWRSASTASA
jgi:hypothetical protein